VPTLKNCIKFGNVQAATVEMRLSQYSSGLTIIRLDQRLAMPRTYLKSSSPTR
jgi:hypothetical protein